jgi:hypothetical protein
MKFRARRPWLMQALQQLAICLIESFPSFARHWILVIFRLLWVVNDVLKYNGLLMVPAAAWDFDPRERHQGCWEPRRAFS